MAPDILHNHSDFRRDAEPHEISIYKLPHDGFLLIKDKAEVFQIFNPEDFFREARDGGWEGQF